MVGGTPPLWGLRLLMPDVASSPPGSKVSMIMCVDCAFLCGATKKNILISLPEQDPLHHGGKYLGLAKRSIYGTRDASLLDRLTVVPNTRALLCNRKAITPSLPHTECTHPSARRQVHADRQVATRQSNLNPCPLISTPTTYPSCLWRCSATKRPQRSQDTGIQHERSSMSTIISVESICTQIACDRTTLRS